jgi:hypothetical protein
MYELKKMERYLRVNLLGPGPRLLKKEFSVIDNEFKCNFIFVNMPHCIHKCTNNLYDYAIINY